MEEGGPELQEARKKLYMETCCVLPNVIERYNEERF